MLPSLWLTSPGQFVLGKFCCFGLAPPPFYCGGEANFVKKDLKIHPAMKQNGKKAECLHNSHLYWSSGESVESGKPI